MAEKKNRRVTITVEELAEVLGRGRLAVYRLLRTGRIPHRLVRGRYILSRVAIERWLEGTDEAPATRRKARRAA